MSRSLLATAFFVFRLIEICLASACRRMRKPHRRKGFFLVVLFSLLGPDFPDKSDIIKMEKEGFSPRRGGVLVQKDYL